MDNLDFALFLVELHLIDGALSSEQLEAVATMFGVFDEVNAVMFLLAYEMGII